MSNLYKTVSIIGLGYIGLPTAAVFASCKLRVVGVDINVKTVETINRGDIHIEEPGLGLVVCEAVREGYLRATTQPEAADAFLIAVPTPFKSGPTGPHHPNVDYIEAAVKSIAPVLKKGDLIILESTSPVGTTETMAAWLAEARPDLTFPQDSGEASDIRVAYCPERVLPGQVLRELVNNDRVIGGMTSRCSEAAATLYKTFLLGECVITDARTAEMCKLTENSYRDVNIAFANELSVICERLSIDVWELIRLANRHPRVSILQPGAGVGGHCIAVDPWFIVSQTPAEARLIRVARTVNDEKPDWVLAQFQAELKNQLSMSHGKSPSDITVACLGVAFKPDIDDLRESPALAIARKISYQHPGKVLVVEPYISALPSGLSPKSTLVDVAEALSQAEIIILLVGHRQFRELPIATWNRIGLIDVCGVSRSA
jgi:UDP-N-acetyl-D-mannosaminuronic acid dehydrogenase